MDASQLDTRVHAHNPLSHDQTCSTDWEALRDIESANLGPDVDSDIRTVLADMLAHKLPQHASAPQLFVKPNLVPAENAAADAPAYTPWSELPGCACHFQPLSHPPSTHKRTHAVCMALAETHR